MTRYTCNINLAINKLQFPSSIPRTRTGMPASCGFSRRLCNSFLAASILSLSAASTMYTIAFTPLHIATTLMGKSVNKTLYSIHNDSFIGRYTACWPQQPTIILYALRRRPRAIDSKHNKMASGAIFMYCRCKPVEDRKEIYTVCVAQYGTHFTNIS